DRRSFQVQYFFEFFCGLGIIHGYFGLISTHISSSYSSFLKGNYPYERNHKKMAERSETFKKRGDLITGDTSGTGLLPLSGSLPSRYPYRSPARRRSCAWPRAGPATRSSGRPPVLPPLLPVRAPQDR